MGANKERAEQLPELMERSRSVLGSQIKAIEGVVESWDNRRRARFWAEIAEIVRSDNPDIQAAIRENPKSLADTALKAVQLDLSLAPNRRECYAIPRTVARVPTVVFQLGYMAPLVFIHRAGEYHQPVVELVYENCEFDHNPASPDPIKHRPWYLSHEAPGDLRFGYFIMHPKGGGPSFSHVMTAKKIYVVANSAKSGPVWKTHFEEMAKKTVVLSACRFVPMLADYKEAVMAEYVEMGTRRVELDDAIEETGEIPDGRYSIREQKVEEPEQPSSGDDFLRAQDEGRV